MSIDKENARKEMAEKLAKATKSGSLAAAYAELKAIPQAEFIAVAIEAGFSIPAMTDKHKQHAEIVAQVVTATRHCTDAYGLRQITKQGTN